MFLITMMLTGHHSFQAYAADFTTHKNAQICSIGCGHHHNGVDICGKIKSDKMQIPSPSFTPSASQSHVGVVFCTKDNTSQPITPIYTQSKISHQELARSHL